MMAYTENKILTEAQADKKDRGKLRLTLVPLQIIRDIATVRMWATQNKYPDKDGWKNVSEERYLNAMLRHLLLHIEDPGGVDEESGLPHWHHVVCNAAFISALRKEGQNGNESRQSK